jgi:hypothetical protein
MRTKSLAIALLVPALLAASCGRMFDDDGSGAGSGGGTGATGGTGGGPAVDHPTGADELVLRVATGGGFVPVEFHLREVPGFSLFGDGRLVVEGPVPEIHPGPALPNLQVSQLSEEAMQAILEQARAAGLFGEDAHYDYPCVTDLPTTTFTLVAEGRTHTVSAYALGFENEMDAGDCGDVDVDARSALLAFWEKLGNLASWLPEGSVGEEEPFTPDEMRVYVLQYRGDPQLEQEPVEWPLAGSLTRFGEPDANLADARCGVVEGTDLDALLPLAHSANQLSPWTSGEREFALVFRPLLPDEHGC